MPTTSLSRLRVIAAFAAVYVVWGSTYLAIRYGLETLPPFVLGGARFVVAGTLLYAWCAWRGAPTPAAREWAWGSLAGVLLLGCGTGGLVWAETRVPSGIAALIVATVALWIVLVEWIRPGGQRPTPLVMAGILLGLAGVAVLVGAQRAGAGHVDLTGALVLVGASLSWALGSLLARSGRMPSPKPLGAAIQMLAGGAWLFALGAVSGQIAHVRPSAVSGRSLIALGYLIVFGSLVGYSAYIWLVTNVAPARAATYAYVNPIVAVLLGWAIAGEAISARMLLASTIIVGAVVLVTLGQHTPSRSPK